MTVSNIIYFFHELCSEKVYNKYMKRKLITMKKHVITMKYKLRLIQSTRTFKSNLRDNLPEGLHKDNEDYS